MEYILIVFSRTSDFIEWAMFKYGRWTVIVGGIVAMVLVIMIQRSPRR